MRRFRAVLDELVVAGLGRHAIPRAHAADVLASGDADLMDMVASAGRLRREFHGDRVRLMYPVNLNSRLCPVDCVHCARHAGAAAGFSWLTPREAAESAAAGVSGGAGRVCLVVGGGRLGDGELDRVAQIARRIAAHHPRVAVCACVGANGQADRLATRGVTTCNRGLGTLDGPSKGLAACTGLVAGRGESDAELLERLFALRAAGAETVPVSFLTPFEGTRLAGTWTLDPRRCLRILAAARFVHPEAELRLVAGRESQLRGLQPLALHIADSLVIGDDDTAWPGAAELEMIADAGFDVDDPRDYP